MTEESATPDGIESSRRPWQIAVLAALLVAAMAALLSSPVPFPEKLVRVEAEQALPSMAPVLEDESIELNLLFLNYASEPRLWMSGGLVLMSHGDLGRKVLLEYGMVEEFQDLLVRLGSDSVLPIGYFHQHDIRSLRARNWIGGRLDQLKSLLGDAESSPVESLTPFRRGLFAIALLSEHGHGMLDQFAVDTDGNVVWLQGERAIAVIGDFFTGGLRGLEREWRRGDGVGVGDVGWAGLDLLVMAGSIKLLRVGKVAGMSRSGRMVGQGRVAASARFASLAPMAKAAAVLGVGYLVVRHPSLLSAAGASVAKWLGWPEWLGQFLVWFLVLLPVLYILKFVLFRVLWPCLRFTAPFARACASGISGRSARPTISS